MATASEQPKKETTKNAGTGLKKCFTALVDRKQVNLDIEVLKLMLKKELQINLDVLDENLAAVMPLMLVMYMKTWPGWQRSKEYFSGKLNFKEWYEKFRQYIVLRLNFLIKNGYNNVIEEIIQEKRAREAELNQTRTVNHGTQTDALAPKTFAPFTICIECPPSVLNSVVFTDAGDDILIRQHPDLPWSDIDIKQLINWPNVEIEFSSPEFSFRRKCFCEYTRYISFSNSPFTYDKADYIEQVEILNPSDGRNCYTLNMLSSYAKEYVSLLKSLRDLDDTEALTIEVVLKEFLKDVEEIDMNKTMATNTSVLFNIGRGTFLRNKKISRSSVLKTGVNTDVGYCEIIVPRMETALHYFKAVQDVNVPNVSFSYLNILKGKIIADNTKASIGTAVPVITYRCVYCNISFKSDSIILKHLEIVHKMEPNVLCVRCKKSISINFLTNIRWKHVCTNNNLFQN